MYPLMLFYPPHFIHITTYYFIMMPMLRHINLIHTTW